MNAIPANAQIGLLQRYIQTAVICHWKKHTTPSTKSRWLATLRFRWDLV